MGRKNVRAWLITWEGKHQREDNVVLLLNAKTAPSRVAELLGVLYANSVGSATERIAQLLHGDSPETPYRARRGNPAGLNVEGHFTCGENPCLYARLVEHVEVESDGNGAEALTWREIEGSEASTPVRMARCL